jgi:hypothetical protein
MPVEWFNLVSLPGGLSLIHSQRSQRLNTISTSFLFLYFYFFVHMFRLSKITHPSILSLSITRLLSKLVLPWGDGLFIIISSLSY